MRALFAEAQGCHSYAPEQRKIFVVGHTDSTEVPAQNGHTRANVYNAADNPWNSLKIVFASTSLIVRVLLLRAAISFNALVGVFNDPGVSNLFQREVLRGTIDTSVVLSWEGDLFRPRTGPFTKNESRR